MEDCAARKDSHAAILRLSREDAARAPAVRGQSHSLGDKGAGVVVEEPRNPLIDAFRLATKRLRGVACLVGSNGGATQSKAVTAASNIICFLQVWAQQGCWGDGRGFMLGGGGEGVT